MNAWQIVGGIMSLIAGAMVLYGTYVQGREDGEFRDDVAEYVKEEIRENLPKIAPIRIEGGVQNAQLVIKNTGNRDAKDVRLIYLDESTPTYFAMNPITRLEEVPRGTEFKIPMNLLVGIGLATTLKNTASGIEEDAIAQLMKFQRGETVFIARFHIEFGSGGEKYVSADYMVVIENTRIAYFGKSDPEEIKSDLSGS